MQKTITVDHICRVEGYGGVTLNVKDGKLNKVEMNIYEGARFLEPLVVGRKFDEVPDILCRICAICSAVHKLTSIQAIEKALEINVSQQVSLLRDLLIQGGNIESHALHVFCLALPDFLKKNSIIACADDYRDQVLMGLNLKKMGNTIQEFIGGRAIHPFNALIGGFGKYPDVDALKRLKDQLEVSLEEAMKAAEFLKTVPIPDYIKSPATYAALKPVNQDFSFFGNEILISGGESIPVENYKELTNESVVSHSNAKQSRYHDKPFMVGALARIILNGNMLKNKAKDILEIFGKTLPEDNILYNNIAQFIEIVYAIERSIEICNILINDGITEEKLPDIRVKASSGTGAIEAPRGTLYHSYSIDNNGCITDADVITPTAQNLFNIEKDLYAAANTLIDIPEEELKFNLEIIVRAYDPCISCSVH